MIGKVLPLSIATFVVMASGVAVLAVASWLGAVLFQISAKDSIIGYTPPVILLSLGLTLTGAFLEHKLTAHKPRRLKPKPIIVAPVIPQQFSHALVAGGKEAEEKTSTNGPLWKTPPSTHHAASSWLESPQTHFEDMGTAKTTSYTWSAKKWGARHDYPPLSGPPDQLEPTITSFSFNCQQCNKIVVIQWAKINTLEALDQLQVDCPHCHQQYPLDYARAQRKTLYISLRGIIRREDETKPITSAPPIAKAETPRQEFPFESPSTPLESPVPQQLISRIEHPQPPIQTVQPSPPFNPTAQSSQPHIQPPQTLQAEPLESPAERKPLAGLVETPVGEAAKAIRNSSKAIVDSVVGNRLFQTVISRIQTSSQAQSYESTVPTKFDHVLVPGGKEGESITQVIPITESKWSQAVTAPAYTSHGSFEDMSSSNNGAETNKTAPTDTTPTIALPDQFQLDIEGFQFNCQDCDKPIPLAWDKVATGPATQPFSVHCPSCQHQVQFNYEQARKKLILFRLNPSPEAPKLVEFFPIVVWEPKPLVESVKRATSIVATSGETPKPKRYSPGIEYDRAILEKG